MTASPVDRVPAHAIRTSSRCAADPTLKCSCLKAQGTPLVGYGKVGSVFESNAVAWADWPISENPRVPAATVTAESPTFVTWTVAPRVLLGVPVTVTWSVDVTMFDATLGCPVAP